MGGGVGPAEATGLMCAVVGLSGVGACVGGGVTRSPTSPWRRSAGVADGGGRSIDSDLAWTNHVGHVENPWNARPARGLAVAPEDGRPGGRRRRALGGSPRLFLPPGGQGPVGGRVVETEQYRLLLAERVQTGPGRRCPCRGRGCRGGCRWFGTAPARGGRPRRRPRHPRRWWRPCGRRSARRRRSDAASRRPSHAGSWAVGRRPGARPT